MNSQEIILKLREIEPALRQRGVTHAALFGSVARGDNHPNSDIDIMVEIDPAATITVFDYVGIKDYISDRFSGAVDVVSRDGMKPTIRAEAVSEAVYAF